MALVDLFPYPWHLPSGRELHIVLCQLYPTGKGAAFAAIQAGLDGSYVNADQAAYIVWKEILDLAAGSRKVRSLVERVRDLQPDSPRRPFLNAVLESSEPPYAGEPRGLLGAPRFVTGSDDVTEREALLFHDDLTLPIGRIPWLIAVLQKLEALGPSVCRLEVSSGDERQLGSGFRIGSDLLLTNWHVVTFSDSTTRKVVAEFGYEDDGRGGGKASQVMPCDVSSVRSDEAADWAVIKVAVPLPDSIPIIKLSESADPEINGTAFIIQHPGGERKRVSYVRNQITSCSDQVVHYLCDTQTGSSGSPVFDDNGRLIALHHAGGRPQEVAGKPPLAKNEGIRIAAVRKGLSAMGIDVP
jgi:V8-like Glu-specific endopeptidase